MTEETKDAIGEIFWVLMFLSPIICVLLVWRFFKIAKFLRVAIGLIIGLLISLICYSISMGIIFRNGMGPV
jgi:hypothetical protein